jgi:PAS domain S-box-containing protein
MKKALLKLHFAFCVSLAIFLVVGIVSYLNIGVQTRAEVWVKHSHEVLSTLADIVSNITEAESARRGYFITENSAFLSEYKSSVAATNAKLVRLRQLTIDNAPQQLRLDELDSLIAHRLRLLADLIDLQTKPSPSDGAQLISKTSESIKLEARIKDLLAEMTSAEQTLLQDRNVKASVSTHAINLTILIGTGLGLVLMSAITYFLHRTTIQNGRAVDAQLASEAKFRGILESAPDAMVIADGQGRIVLVNAETERLFGYSRDELVGQLVDILVPERFRGKHPQHRQGYTAHPRPRLMGEGADLRGLRKDNTEFSVEISLSPIETPEGTLISSAIRDVTARKAAERAQRASEAKFRGILESAPDAMVIADGQGRIVLVNAETERLFGYSRDELVGQLVDILVPERFRGKHPQHRQGYTAHPRPRAMGEGADLRGLRKDNTEFSVEISLSPIETPEGTLISSAIRDVTARRAAEKRIAHMEDRYRTLLEAAPDAMVVANQAGEIILVNVQAEKQFGYRRDELVGQKVGNIIPKGFAEQLVVGGTPSAVEVIAQQIRKGLELIARRKDGTEFPIEIMLSPMESPEGILVTAAVRDISERKHAEDALQQSENRLRVLIDGVKDYAILMLDPKGLVTTWGEGAERIKGYRAEEIIGQSFSRFYLPEAIAQQKPSQELKIAEEQGRFEEEGWRVRKDGSRFWANVVITALRDETGQLRGFAKVNRDFSERKKSDEQLAKTLTELKRSNEELQQFAYVASHDLQEPLRMVASYTQLLAQRYKGRLDADADEFIAYAVDGSNRMQGLIQDLLAYSRAGTNGKALGQVSSEDALDEALNNLRAMIEESGTTVTHDALPPIKTDESQLVQVFQNLVGNAMKYHGVEAPRVHVSATKNGAKEWIFSIRDNGMGIDSQYFERIFIIFQRLHGREEFEGTGIGLAICKKIVERMGGRIWVESQLEKGSTFFFALPERDGE